MVTHEKGGSAVDENITKISLTDNPLNRAGIGVIEHFGDDLPAVMEKSDICEERDTESHKQYTKEQEANARLTSAAPEYFHACKEVLVCEERRYTLPGLSYEALKQAVDKAEGR